MAWSAEKRGALTLDRRPAERNHSGMFQASVGEIWEAQNLAESSEYIY